MKLDKLSEIHNHLCRSKLFSNRRPLRCYFSCSESFPRALTSVCIQQQAYCKVYWKYEFPRCGRRRRDVPQAMPHAIPQTHSAFYLTVRKLALPLVVLITLAYPGHWYAETADLVVFFVVASFLWWWEGENTSAIRRLRGLGSEIEHLFSFYQPSWRGQLNHGGTSNLTQFLRLKIYRR